MKKYHFISISLLLGLFIVAGCADKKPKETINTLQDNVKEIQKLEKRSENIQNAEQAFTLLRDLNKTMKDVRNAVLELDANYPSMKDESRKQEIEQRFEEINKELNASLATISENVKPYKDDERVTQITNKLNEVLISK